MKKLVTSLLCLSLLGMNMFTSIDATKASEDIQPRLPVVYCEGSSTSITRRAKTNLEFIGYTNIYLNIGDSLSVAFGYTDSVSNSASFNLIPDLINYGYSRSVSISSTQTITVNNNTDHVAHVGAYRVYDIVYYTNASYIGNNTCTVSNGSRNVYTGYLLKAV